MYYWLECKLVQPLSKALWRFLKKLEIELLYDPAILLLGIYLKEKKINVPKRYLHPHFYCNIIYNSQAMKTTLVCIDRWINKEKVVYMHTIEYYSAMKMKDILLFTITWTDFERALCSMKWVWPRNTSRVWSHSYVKSIKKQTHWNRECIVCRVSQSCPTLCNPMDCSPPGSSVHGDSPDKNTGVGCPALLQGIFPTQVSHIAGGIFTSWATREAQRMHWWLPKAGSRMGELGESGHSTNFQLWDK